MDARIGQVVREGKTIYYAFIGGRELSNLVESDNEQDIEDLLDGKTPAAKPVAPKQAEKAQGTTYIVHVSMQWPAWNEKEGYDVEVQANSKAEANKLVRDQEWREGMHIGNGRVFYMATTKE